MGGTRQRLADARPDAVSSQHPAAAAWMGHPPRRCPCACPPVERKICLLLPMLSRRKQRGLFSTYRSVVVLAFIHVARNDFFLLSLRPCFELDPYNILSFHPKIVDILVWIRKFRRKKSKGIWHTETNKERDIDALRKIKIHIWRREIYIRKRE